MLAYLRKHITVKLRSVVQTAGHFGVIQEAVESNIKVLCFIRPYHLSLIAAVAECETKYVLGKSACRNGADSSTADKPKSEQKNPQTGSGSGMSLWLAMLLISGGAAMGIKKKHKK